MIDLRAIEALKEMGKPEAFEILTEL